MISLKDKAQQGTPLADTTLKGSVFWVAEQMSLFEEEAENTITELEDLDLYNVTPMEVMMAVASEKEIVKRGVGRTPIKRLSSPNLFQSSTMTPTVREETVGGCTNKETLFPSTYVIFGA